LNTLPCRRKEALAMTRRDWAPHPANREGRITNRARIEPEPEPARQLSLGVDR
jgi:hypothetical protein